MKKLLFVFAVAAFTACGNGDTAKTENAIDSSKDAAKDMIDSSKNATKDSADNAAKMMKDSVDHSAKMMKDTAKKM